MMEMDERQIIAAIRAGDTEQFGTLYDAYFQKIYNYIFYRTRHRETAEDLVSATFLKAVNHLGRFDAGKGNFSAWLYRIARNTLYDHYRGAKATENLDDVAEPAAEGSLEYEIFIKQASGAVKENFNILSKEQREVITMRIWDGLAYSEIAEIMEKSEASCKTIFHRGMVKLRETVEKMPAYQKS